MTLVEGARITEKATMALDGAYHCKGSTRCEHSDSTISSALT